MASLYLKTIKRAAQTAVFSMVMLANQAFAQQQGPVTFFPPDACQPGQVNVQTWDGVSNTKCIPMPSCPSKLLSFDGANFSCVQVPTCAAGELLTYNGTTFNCTNVATALTAAQAALNACTSTTQINVQACPAGETGQIYNQVTTNSCDGSVTTTPINTCMVYLNVPMLGINCTPGSTVSGQYVNGIFNGCTAGSAGCLSYTCTPSGLVAQ